MYDGVHLTHIHVNISQLWVSFSAAIDMNLWMVGGVIFQLD